MVAGGNDVNTEPMRWSLHGGPRTGKSHVIQILKKFMKLWLI